MLLYFIVPLFDMDNGSNHNVQRRNGNCLACNTTIYKIATKWTIISEHFRCLRDISKTLNSFLSIFSFAVNPREMMKLRGRKYRDMLN